MKNLLFENRSIAPSKVVCIGRNYVEHIEELGNEMPSSMVVFNKPNSAISDRLRFWGAQTRFEAEICFVIEGGAIAGVGAGLDLTHADTQNTLKSKGLPWERAKAFDGAAVLSDFVPIAEAEIPALEMMLYLNGTLRQHATYDLMIYKPEAMLAEIGRFMTLEDGDIIMSGTPKGVGYYAHGDRFEIVLRTDEREVLRCEWVAE